MPDQLVETELLKESGLRGFPWITASILYTISYGWLWTVRSSYWIDDWTVFVAPSQGDRDWSWTISGLAPWIRIPVLLHGAIGPEILRFFIFVSFFASAVFLYGILGKFDLTSQNQRKYITLLFLLLPFNSARVALMLFHYTTGYFYFFAAWYLLVNFSSRRARVFSALLFFASFQMHSLLVFFTIPCAHLLYLEQVNGWRKLLAFVRRYFGLLSLPVIYWIAKLNFWPTLDDYNKLDRNAILNAMAIVVTVGILTGVFLFWRHHTKYRKNSLLPIFIGVNLIFIGLFPYLVTGVFGKFSSLWFNYSIYAFGRGDWYGRHLTLQPLGAAFVAAGLVYLIPLSRRNIRKIAQRSLLTICVLFNIGFGFEYVVDYAKQRTIVHEIESANAAVTSSRFVFIDYTENLNARGRTYRPRDWWGLIGSAYDFRLAREAVIDTECGKSPDGRVVTIGGPSTHWQALKNLVTAGNMKFDITINDLPGSCDDGFKFDIPRCSAIPILFYFRRCD